ncbi:hypothetical protein [Myroides phaeus]|nr:hypothetical protein [Myroides phaeus]
MKREENRKAQLFKRKVESTAFKKEKKRKEIEKRSFSKRKKD